MTPRDRAEKIVERFLSTPEGFAPDDKQALIAAIEQGMNEVIDEAGEKVGQLAVFVFSFSDELGDYHSKVAQALFDARKKVLALKSPDNSRNTITDNQKDEKR